MATDIGGSRLEREKLVTVHPSAGDLPIARHFDSDTIEKFHTFSDPAKAELSESIVDYTRILVCGAVAAREADHGYQVTEYNVKMAATGMNRREETSAARKLAGIVGGILLGIGVSNFIAILQIGKFDKTGIILAAVASTVGAFLIAVDLPRMVRPSGKNRRSYTPVPPVKVRRRPMNQSPGQG